MPAPKDPDTIVEPTPTTEPELSPDAAALAAMDEGIATETPEPTEPAEPTPPAAETVAEPVPGTPEAAAKAEADAKAAAEAGDGKTKPEPKPEPDKATEDEIKALGLKEKSADRFRTLAGEVKTLAPIKAAMEAAGIKDPAQIPVLVQRSKDFEDFIDMVQETKTNPEQYGQALDYLKLVNAAASGDRAAGEQAFKIMQQELTFLAAKLGKEVPGVHDPLAEHKDLADEVEAGDLTRARALEIAEQRNALRMEDGRRVQQTSQEQQTEAIRQGVQNLNTLGQQLAAVDPHYAAKLPALLADLATIKQTLPPARWVQATLDAYAKLPAPAAPAVTTVTPAAPRRPAPGPVHSGALRPALQPTTDDPAEAMDLGIAAASG